MYASISSPKRIALALAFAAVLIYVVSCTSQSESDWQAALDTVIEGSTSSEVLQSTNKIAPLLSDEDRERLTKVRFEYIAAYGEEKACDLLRGKTVRQVFHEFKPTGVKPIETGVTDGVEWSLYAKPSTDETPAASSGTEPENALRD